MSPITNEGKKDFETISLIATGKGKALSAHTILSKYRIETENDFTNALSSLVPHPIALAFHFNRSNIEGPEHNEAVRFRLLVCGFIREYAKAMLLDCICIAQTRLKRDKLIQKRKSGRWGDSFWNDHTDTCIICNRVVMKKYEFYFGWKKCDDCKGWICPYCDCQKYHLSQQATLLGVSLKPVKSKHRNKKKANMGVRKSNNETQVVTTSTLTNLEPAIEKTPIHGTLISATSDDLEKPNMEARQDLMITVNSASIKRKEPSEERVDFVQYLEETNSIIALAHLMDGLELQGYDFEGESFECITVDIE